MNTENAAEFRNLELESLEQVESEGSIDTDLQAEYSGKICY